MPFDPNTIGPKECEKILGNILKKHNNPKIINKAMGIYLDFKLGARHISKIENKSICKRAFRLFYEDIILKTKKAKLPDEVTSFLRCCITAEYREVSKNIEEGTKPTPILAQEE